VSIWAGSKYKCAIDISWCTIFEAKWTIWSICDVNQWIVSYWRIYDKSSMKNIMNKKIMDIALSNTIGMVIVKKERSNGYTFLFMAFIMEATWRSQQDKCQHSCSTWRRVSIVCLWKTRRDVWVMKVVEEELTRTWLWWTMHQRRASERLDIEIPDVTEKGK
jgi:hypothetical protein